MLSPLPLALFISCTTCQLLLRLRELHLCNSGKLVGAWVAWQILDCFPQLCCWFSGLLSSLTGWDSNSEDRAACSRIPSYNPERVNHQAYMTHFHPERANHRSSITHILRLRGTWYRTKIETLLSRCLFSRFWFVYKCFFVCRLHPTRKLTLCRVSCELWHNFSERKMSSSVIYCSFPDIFSTLVWLKTQGCLDLIPSTQVADQWIIENLLKISFTL